MGGYFLKLHFFFMYNRSWGGCYTLICIHNAGLWLFPEDLQSVHAAEYSILGGQHSLSLKVAKSHLDWVLDNLDVPAWVGWLDKMPAVQGRSRSVSPVTLRSSQICLPKQKHRYQVAPSSMQVMTSPVWCAGTGLGLGKGCWGEGQLSTAQGSLHTAWTLQSNKGHSCQFFTYMSVFSCTLAACNTRCWLKDGSLHLYWLVVQGTL